MPEELLQFIWENRLFETENLFTTGGLPVEIIDTGRRNSNAGPDFFNARIKIDDTIWVGNVEVHRTSGDWNRHNHQNDAAYNNVILHVVGSADSAVFRQNGEEIPELVLKFPDYLIENYQTLITSKSWIPCSEKFHKIDPFVLQMGFNRLMIERLEDKTTEILTRLKQNNNDWNETFYQELARSFGFKVNSLPFEMLAKSLPLNILAKHKNSLFQTEALLFGSSGLLNEQLLGDDYFLSLRNEYSFLYKKYNLKPIESHLWKFLRLRPVNFPTIRISQFAALVCQSKSLFSKITETPDLEGLQTLFKVKASDYWNAHFNFNKHSKQIVSKEIGIDSVNILIINVVVPFLFVYGEIQGKEYLKNRSLEFLEKLPAENNSVIEKWEKLGVVARSAFESQALLQLKNRYCENKKCLNCHIGVKLVKATGANQ